MSEPLIKIETFPNLLGRGYHTTCELSGATIFTVDRPFKPELPVNQKRFPLFGKIGQLIITNTHLCNIYQERPPTHGQAELLDVGVQGVKMCEALFAIEGVTNIYVKPYEVSVYIGQAFKWCDVEPQILDVIKQRFKNPEKVSIEP